MKSLKSYILEGMDVSKSEINKILFYHKMWLDGERGGFRADLWHCNLIDADLKGVDLREANLRETNLIWPEGTSKING